MIKYESDEIISSKFETCIVCNDSSFMNLPCKCTTCEECLFSWTASNNFSDLFSKFQILKCPNHKCNKDLPLGWILENLNLKNRNCILEIFNKKFLNTSSGFKMCPNQYCDYVGWLNTGMKCSQPLECELCKMKWDDSSLFKFPVIHKITQLMKQFKENVLCDISEIKDKLLYAPCIHCGTNNFNSPISKGNFACTSCKKYLCFLCMSDHASNNKLPTIYCIYKLVFIFVGVFMLTSFSIIKLFLSSYLLREFTKWLLYLIVINASAAVGTSVTCFFGYYALYDFLSRILYYDREPFVVQKVISFILLSILLFTKLSFYMKFDVFFRACNYIIMEAFILLPCYYIYNKYKRRPNHILY